MDEGTDTITDLGGSGGGDVDILIVSSGAIAQATGIVNFVADSSTKNEGIAQLTAAAGGTINMTDSNTGGYTITGNSGNETLTGGSGDDTFVISATGEGDGDTYDGKGGSNSLQLSAGTHTLTTDNNVKNITTILAHSDGSSLDLSTQSESFTITGNTGGDVCLLYTSPSPRDED